MMWGIAILFFFYEFFLRVLPATCAQDIIQSLSLSVEQFSLIGSAYYITYSFMQIPVGLLLDKFNAKILITLASAACTFGALWFTFAQSFAPAFISRLFIGLGSAFGFVALMIVTLNWFPRKYFAFLVGCGQSLGAIGPLIAGAPIALLLKAVNNNWRLIFLGVALFGVSLTLLIALFFKGKPSTRDKIIFVDEQESLGKRAKTLLSRPQVWMTMIYGSTAYVSLPLLGAFWGTSYLQAKGFSNTVAALMISMIWVGLATASPLFGNISDRMKRRKPMLVLSSILGIMSTSLIILAPIDHPYFLGVLFFFVGMGGAGQNLSFAIMTEQAPEELRATALGLNNTAIMGFAALLPLFVTSIIQSFAVDGILSEKAFEMGLIVLPVTFLLSLIIALFALKETFCRRQNTIHKIEA